MRLTKNKLRKIILQEMADIVTYGPDGTPISSRPDKDRNTDTWGSRAESGEWVDSPERQEAERIKKEKGETEPPRRCT